MNKKKNVAAEALRDLAKDCESDRAEALLNLFFQEIDDDDSESQAAKAWAFVDALNRNDAKDLLTALCGWSLESLLTMAKLIPDVENRFYKASQKGTISVLMQNGCSWTSPCAVNLQTFEASDFPKETIRQINAGKESFLVMDDHLYPLAANAEKKSCTTFWYNDEGGD